MDEEDYEYESDEEVEWTEEMLDMEQGDIRQPDAEPAEDHIRIAKRHVSLFDDKILLREGLCFGHRLFFWRINDAIPL